MITDIFRLDDNVPRIYVNESRDFQMLCRLFTYGMNPSKYEAEMLHYLNSGMLTNDRLLGNLCEKTSFMDGEFIKGDKLRYITENFAKIVRDKGAEIGIVNSVYLYNLIYNLGADIIVNCDQENFIVRIGINSPVKDVEVLYTILKYIIPIGWIVEIFFFAKLTATQGYYYRDTFVNIVRRASAKNALYIIRTNNTSSDLIPPVIGRGDPSPISYNKFGNPSYDMSEVSNTVRGNTHITKYTGSLAINSLSSNVIASLADDLDRLTKYGVELWDAEYTREGRINE